MKRNALNRAFFSNFREYEGVGYMFVTTVGRAGKETMILAKSLAEELQIPFIARRKRSVRDIQAEQNEDDCLVFGKKRMELYRYYKKNHSFFTRT